MVVHVERKSRGMPRLTAELIADSPQFTNAVKDWELDLRGKRATSLYIQPFDSLGYLLSRAGQGTFAATLTPTCGGSLSVRYWPSS